MKLKENKSVQKILVSNPGRQYTHQLLYGLDKNKINYHFFTSFWFKPDYFPFSLLAWTPDIIRKKLEATLKKRYFEKVNQGSVSQFPYFEIFRELTDKLFGQKYSERMQYRRDRIHDRWVASRLNISYKIIIGYEEACILTFQKAKQMGITTILDLAQIHYKDIEEISSKHEHLGALYKNKKLRKKINNIKEKEIALADYIICLSEFAKVSLIRNGVSSDKIFVCRPGFDPEKFKAKIHYPSAGKLKVIFTGTLTQRKGIDIILKAYAELSDLIDLTFVGPMADAKNLGPFDKRITFYPQVDHMALSNLLRQSDLFIFPSYLDSWAMVVIEAMAVGLPVIVSDNTGAKETVLNGSGFVVTTGSKEELKEKILHFCMNPLSKEKMGKIARQYALNYTWDIYHENLIKIIKRIQENEPQR